MITENTFKKVILTTVVKDYEILDHKLAEYLFEISRIKFRLQTQSNLSNVLSQKSTKNYEKTLLFLEYFVEELLLRKFLPNSLRLAIFHVLKNKFDTMVYKLIRTQLQKKYLTNIQ